MTEEPLEIHVALQLQRTADVIFEAIVDPDKMSNYFISKSTGRMEEGKTLTWNFPEFEAGFPVRIGTIEQDHVIAYSWDVDGRDHLCTITLKPEADGSTVVAVTEKAITGTGNIAWLQGNTEGWANFLACLKAYLEYGINLRKGAFTWRFKEEAV
jgi:uncharacterized protein YndB with AHSA1/START domain